MKHRLLEWYFHMMGYFAKKYLARHTPFVIGVTGSVGKTSCRMVISEFLSQQFPKKIIYTSDTNFNGELGMSLSILGVQNYTPSVWGVIKVIMFGWKQAFFGKKLYDVVFLEYGIDHKKEMDFLLSIVTPDIGIVTKIDAVHAMQFHTKKEIAQEKYKLLQYSQEAAFFNKDDEYAKNYVDEIKTQPYWYASQVEHLDDTVLQVKNAGLIRSGAIAQSQFEVYVQDELLTTFTTNLLGEENIGYVVIALKIAQILQQKWYQNDYFEDISPKMFVGFTLQPGRFGIFEGIHESIVVDSTYNAAPESMKKVLQNFLSIHSELYPQYKMILCLGEMRELGDYGAEAHGELASFLHDIDAEIYLVGESMQKYVYPLLPQSQYFTTSKALGEHLVQHLSTTDEKYFMLFKGSQNTIFLEEALKPVLKNPEDSHRLCRQEGYWLKNKDTFFSSQG